MSLRSRLLFTFAVLALGFAGTAVAIVRTVNRSLIDQIDTQLDSATGFDRFGDRRGDRPGDDDAHGTDDTSADDVQPPPRPDGDDRVPTGFNSFYVAVVQDGVITRLATPDLSDVDYPDPDLDVDELARRTGDSRLRHFTVDAAGDDDLAYRVEVRADPASGDVYVLGSPLDGVAETMEGIRRAILAVGVALLALLALVAWWIIRLGLRPIRVMADAAEGIAAGSLSERVPEGPAGTEAAQLGAALNGMLGRLEASFDEQARTEERLRRFAADASHELRTPIQTIRGYGELYRMGALDAGAGLDDAMRRTEQEAARMGRIIEDLLLLARLDQQRPLDIGMVDLSRLAADTLGDGRARDPERSFALDAAEPVLVAGDELRLRQVLANLVSNALLHTPRSSAVEITVERVGSEGIVRVSDQGPGMSPDAVEHAFERFYRADVSRARASGGSGLGLSIVREILVAHGGGAELSSSPESGTTVTIRVPLAARGT